jgi:Pectate lyase superfamily protein/Periplasmic copper-binding protein (NosD)
MISNFYSPKINTIFFFSIVLYFNHIQAQIVFEPQPSFFRTQRQMPLVSLTTTQDINVAQFGAKPNDSTDDLAAIQAAINAAKSAAAASKPVRIVFEKGTYDIMPATGASHSLFVENAKHILFEGNGAEILNHNPAIGFFSVKSCTNIIFKDFIFDYSILPFTQGKVTAVDTLNNSFTLKIDTGFPLLTDSHFTTAREKWGCLKDATGKLKNGVKNLFPYKGWTQIAENTFKVNTTNKDYTKEIEVGDYFVQIARNNGRTIFNTSGSKNITYLNINIYASPAGSFSGQENYEVNIINCKVVPKPGTGRVQSGNADIIHISGSYLGPWVQGCRFEAYTDDAVNLKHTARDIIEVVSPTVLKIKKAVTITDKVVLFNPRDGVILGKTPLAITEVVHLGNAIFEVTFNGNHNVTTVGENQKADKLYLSSRSSESFIFRNNTIKNGRRYGVLLQSSYGQIKDCTFENLSSSGVKLENGVDWGEGFAANTIEITDNKFINCGFDTSYISDPDAAAISTLFSKLQNPCKSERWCGTETAKLQALENIIITNNHFTYNKAALNIQNLNGGLILNNTYIHNANDPTLKSGESPREVHSFNCSNLHFEALGNKSSKK